MSSTTATSAYLKADYLQPLNSTSYSSSSSSYDSSQSPLALLAQTCSSIGKDSPSPPSSSSSSSLSLNTSLLSNTAPPIITSLVTKSSSILSSTSNSDKSLLSSKRSSPSQTNCTLANKKSTHPVKSLPTNTSVSSFVDSNPLSTHLPTLFDPTTTAAALLLRSSLAYIAAQQQQQHHHQHQQHSFSSPCTVPSCLQCETVRHIFAASIAHHPYHCHWYSCNARFSSADELVEHLRHSHTSTSKSSSSSFSSSIHQHNHHHHRFHPYFKPPMMLNNNDQLPFFYPHLSLSPMTGTTRRTNNNTNNNN